MSSVTGTGESHDIKDIAIEWRAHWRTGLAAFVGMGLGGSMGPTVFSLFIKPLEDAFGWSRGEIGLANMASIGAALAAPFLGRIIDKKGTRGPLLISFMALGLFWLLLAAMPGPIIVYYVLFTGLTIVGLPSTGLGYARAMSAVFVKSRGFSLAMTRAGMSLSAVILPMFLYAVIDNYGWRGGYIAMAGLALLVGLPIAWAGIERAKKSPNTKVEAPTSPTRPPLPAFHFFKDRKVVTIALATAFAYTPLIAIVSQAQPLIISKGIDAATAATLVGLFGASSVLGAFVTGFFLDRIWAPAVAMVIMLIGAAGALVLAFLPGTVAVAAIGVLLVGFAMGAETDISAFVVARFCGVANFSAVYGIVILAISLASSVGSSGIGFMYDANGDYVMALIISAICFLIGGLGYLALGRYPTDPDSVP